MQFLLFEYKLILKHKLYLLYCMIVAALFAWTAGLFSIGENLEPLDETHVLVRTLLEDSGREQIVNGHLLDIAQICADLVSMKDRVHVRTVQSVMAGILSAGFVLMVGVAMRQPLGVCLFVGACTVGLGCICSVVSKFACGIIGGMLFR